MSKVLFWDIESTNLNADFGYILCIGYMFLGDKKPKIISIDDFKHYDKDRTNDGMVVSKFKEVFDTADIHVTWYGSRFDLPMVNTRLVSAGKHILAPIPHIDLWRTARYGMKLSSNRLANVQRYLKLPDEKSPVDGRVWVRAMAGHKKELKYIKKHCYQDILVLEQAYEKMRPLINAHPNVNLLLGGEGCPTCGSTKIQRRGLRVVRTSKFQRYHCQNCGSWSSRPTRVLKDGTIVETGVIR